MLKKTNPSEEQFKTELIQQINHHCTFSGGGTFKPNCLRNIRLVEQYVKRGIFKKWVLISDKTRLYAPVKTIESLNKMLSSLPDGITYKSTEHIVSDGRETDNRLSFCERTIEYNYEITISPQYLESVLGKIDNSTFIHDDKAGTQFINEATEFYSKVVNNHTKLLDSLLQELIESKSLYFSINEKIIGFTDEKGLLYSTLGMKPLSTPQQKYGLAMALSERIHSHFMSQGKDIKMYLIKCDYSTSAYEYRPAKNPDLKDW